MRVHVCQVLLSRWRYKGVLGKIICFKCKQEQDSKKFWLLQTLRAPQNPQKWWVEWASNIETINTSQIARARPLDPLKIDRTSIFVGNLDEQVTETDLQEIFVQYGEIAHVHVVRKPGVGLDQKRVFAFIKYNSEKEASNAIENEVWKKNIHTAYGRFYPCYLRLET